MKVHRQSALFKQISIDGLDLTWSAACANKTCQTIVRIGSMRVSQSYGMCQLEFTRIMISLVMITRIVPIAMFQESGSTRGFTRAGKPSLASRRKVTENVEAKLICTSPHSWRWGTPERLIRGGKRGLPDIKTSLDAATSRGCHQSKKN